MQTIFESENLGVRVHLEGLGVHERIILKLMRVSAALS
jgi:hypothetical protein